MVASHLNYSHVGGTKLKHAKKGDKMPLIKLKSSSIADSVNLRGQPTSSNPNSGIATTQMVQQEVSNLVNGAPTLLNTLGEIANSLGNNNSQTE